jgi:hypothetical protein
VRRRPRIGGEENHQLVAIRDHQQVAVHVDRSDHCMSHGLDLVARHDDIDLPPQRAEVRAGRAEFVDQSPYLAVAGVALGDGAQLAGGEPREVLASADAMMASGGVRLEEEGSYEVALLP